MGEDRSGLMARMKARSNDEYERLGDWLSGAGGVAAAVLLLILGGYLLVLMVKEIF